jgi:hypothetical protein
MNRPEKRLIEQVYFSGSIGSGMGSSDQILPRKTPVPVRYVFLRMGVSVAV